LIGAILEGVQQMNLSDDEYGAVKEGLYEIQADDYEEFENQLKTIGKSFFGDKPDGEHGGEHDNFINDLYEKFAQDYPDNREQLIGHILNEIAQFELSEEEYGHVKEAVMALAGSTFEDFAR
jgi:Lon protease-like protein